MSDTALALERMTDAAKFEELAMAVLRRVRPEYRGLIHTGINTEGKTVKSPLDGILMIPAGAPPHFVIVHHTTAQRDDLRKKWLYKNLPGKPSKTPDGDVVKAIRWAEEQHQENPAVRATLVLTCNRIPPEDLVADVGLACYDGGIEHEIVDLSRLQDFLDVDRDGQWIRKLYLGIEQERLSEDLLRKLSERSHREYSTRELWSREEEWVPRSLDRELRDAVFEGRSGSVTLLVSDSGHGKSTATCRLLGEHLQTGGFGLWLEPEIVRQAPTIEAAVEATLRGLHPRIETGCGPVAIELARLHGDLLLAVDDVNKTSAPASLVQKVAGWDDGRKQPEEDGESSGKAGYRIVCPVWPQVIGQVADAAEKAVRSLCFFAGPFSPEEGAAALQRQASLAGVDLTDLEAHELSERLGHDPLLLSLWSKTRGEVKSDGLPVSAQVIDRFVLKRLAEVSGSAPETGLVKDYEETFLALSRRMLEERTLEPPWEQVSSWFLGTEHAGRVRKLANQREIVRLDGEGRKLKLAFRHDRLRDYLLTRAFHVWMAHGEASPSLLSDPYYAEILGQALLFEDLDLVWASRIAAFNPLALFYAFQTFRQPTTPMERAILESIRQWLRDVLIPECCTKWLRWSVDQILAETDSPLVIELTEGFPFPSYPLWEARMRNGDVEAAAWYCGRFGIGVPHSRLDLLSRHARVRYGGTFVQDLAALLERSDLSEDLRIGALYLAGYLGAPELESAIGLSWTQGNISADLMKAHLWAGLRCCTESAPLLDPIFEAWASLPDEPPQKNMLPDRERVSHGLPKALAEVELSGAVVAYLLKRAQEPSLARQLFWILQHLDDPDALEFCLRHRWGWDITSLWDSRLFGRKPLVKSRHRLQEIWNDEADDEKTRQRAFDLWALGSGSGEIELLRMISPSSVLYDQALQKRAELKDLTCVDEVVAKLEGDKHPSVWWFFCDRIWSEPIRQALDRWLERRENQAEKTWGGAEIVGDGDIARLLTLISRQEAEEVLARHWSQLCFRPEFVQTALYVNTLRTRELVAEAVQKCPAPESPFRNLRFGELGQAVAEGGLFPEHLESLAPYLHLFEKDEIEWLWYACNHWSHFQWRREHVDPLLPAESRCRYGLLDEDLFTQLDNFAAGARSKGWIGLWLGEFPQRGDPADRAMRVVADWLRERSTFAALEVAAECVALGGTRKDLTLLEGSSLPPQDLQVANVVEATRLRVLRRSLQ